jgi:hypothetical protein
MEGTWWTTRTWKNMYNVVGHNVCSGICNIYVYTSKYCDCENKSLLKIVTGVQFLGPPPPSEKSKVLRGMLSACMTLRLPNSWTFRSYSVLKEFSHHRSVFCEHEISSSEIRNSLKGLETKKNPWLESASELYRPSDSRLSAKLVSTLADRGRRVVSATNSHSTLISVL